MTHVASAATPESHGLVVLIDQIIVLPVLRITLVLIGLHQNARTSRRDQKLPWHRRFWHRGTGSRTVAWPVHAIGSSVQLTRESATATVR
jgi:hypothetical protein